ncbi:hypothetical protein [Actinoallomurus sp. NPDC052274]|uniref:hypothetical protein n=1 Tax=Actinoallomurus sp. NPDC052274 TaxID=3155420 RepID=UPI003428DE25
MTTAVVVDGLHKTYGAVRAVDGVSFTVEHGEIFALLTSDRRAPERAPERSAP